MSSEIVQSNWKESVQSRKDQFISKDGKIDSVVNLLRAIGEDPTREGLLETPSRVVKSWLEIFEGYFFTPEDIADMLSKSFGDVESYNEMIVCNDISFTSFCEHHMLPFTGKAHFAYIPDKENGVVGLSKIPRLVDVFSKRLQIQERLTTQIVDAFTEYVRPLGCAVIIQGEHSCVSCRGIKKNGSVMITSALRGCFTKQATRQEFLDLIKL